MTSWHQQAAKQAAVSHKARRLQQQRLAYTLLAWLQHSSAQRARLQDSMRWAAHWRARRQAWECLSRWRGLNQATCQAVQGFREQRQLVLLQEVLLVGARLC